MGSKNNDEVGARQGFGKKLLPKPCQLAKLLEEIL